jgi:competence protein ComEC
MNNAEIISVGGTAITIRGLTNGFKNKLIEIYDTSLPMAESGIIKAMILGDKSSIDERVAELYRVGGIYHILAISGLHITIIAFILDFLIRKAVGPVYSGIFSLLVLCLYAVFTGLAVSTIRAVIMFGVHVFGRVLWRKNDLLSSTAFAACILLIFNPYYLWDAGFLLSFSSVFGIGFSANIIKKALASLPKEGLTTKALNSTKFLSDGLSASIGLTLFNMPVAAAVFYQVPMYGIVANLIIVPTLVFVIIGGIIVGIAGFISLPLASFLSGVLFFIFKFYELICTLIEKLPASMLLTGQIPIHYILIWYFMVVSLLMLLKPGSPKRKLHLRCVLGSIIALVILFGIDDINNKTLNYVTMLDVGQGDCIIIRNNGKTFLVDGGNPWNSNEILSYLLSNRINRLDGVFITHADSDHMGGIASLVGKIDISEIYFPPNYGTLAASENELTLKANEFNIAIKTISAGDRISFPGGEILCLHPSLGFSSEINENSLVLRYETFGKSFLLTGDIGIDEERQILRSSQGYLSSYALKLAHHGSAYSNSEPFLAEVSPQIAFVGTGRRNSYGHPSERVVKSLNEMGIPLYNTAETGQITIYVSRDGETEVRTMLKDIN